MSTKNYVFAASSPIEKRDEVISQMHLAHRYRNRLCELELQRRAAADAFIRTINPEYAAISDEYQVAVAAVNAAYDAIKAERAKSRKRLEPTEQQKAAIAESKKTRDEVVERLVAAKTKAFKAVKELQAPYWEAADAAVVDPDLKPATRKQRVRQHAMKAMEEAGVDAGQAEYERATKAARAECGCYWGTYLVVEDACKDFGQGKPPIYKRWEGFGTIGVQIQGGLNVVDALACRDTQLQIEIPHEDLLYDKGELHGRDAIGTVRMRIGSDGRSPIWAEIPVRFHRPLPHNGSIRNAFLHAELSPHGEQWSLRLTINEQDEDDEPEQSDSLVALHFGWRVMENDDLRTCVWVGSDGRSGEVILDSELREQDGAIAKVKELRDLCRDEFAPELIDWLTEHREILPEWLSERTKTIDKWRAQRSFHELCLAWRDKRFPGDTQMFEQLNRWRKTDKHRWQHEDRLRDRMIGYRTDLYRKTIVELKRHYAHAVVANVQWSKLAKRAKTDEEVVQTDAQRHNARLASPGYFQQLLKEYYGDRLHTVPAADITTRCHVCGEKTSMNRANRYNVCDECGADWDQDVNAAHNTLASGQLLLKTPGSLADNDTKEVTSNSDVIGVGQNAVNGDEKTTARKTRRNRKAKPVL